MRERRTYTCEGGHRWHVAAQSTEDPWANDPTCPCGREVVTCSRDEPADEVQVLLRPVALASDPRIGHLEPALLKDRYWFVLLDRADQELAVSTRHYSWSEVLGFASFFRGKTRDEALKWWKRRDL